jgi:3-hydroxyisobutyrate dehydrogenase
MGSSIAQRLMAVGHEVGVWNRNADRTKPLTQAGARPFASPAELIGGCEAIVVMLLNDAASEAVYRGANGILGGDLAGRLVIDMSTVRPDTMISLGTAVKDKGGAFVECPVGGRRKKASCSGLPAAKLPISPKRCRCWSNCAAASSMSEVWAPARP